MSDRGAGATLERTTVVPTCTFSLGGEASDGGPGTILGGRYALVRLLKQGNGVETFLGTDCARAESVVVKSVHCDALSLKAQLRLEHEARVLAQLHCPWLAPLIHLGREGERLYLVMEFVPGRTLEARLRHGPLSVNDALTVGRSLFHALQAAHEQHILHRDVKPGNIIVDDGEPLERATLLDFGLAGSALLDSTIRHQPVGTARYMSPESAGLLGQEPDERSDLYGAGVVLFECLAGRPPFHGANVGEVLHQHMTTPAPELRGLGIAVPRALDAIVQRLLRKDPRDRYQSAQAVLADLDRIAAALEQGVAEPALVVGLHDRRQTLTQPAFVGRQWELAALEARLTAAQRGDGGLVLLEAESGGGKTRLLDELQQRSAGHNVWVLRGQGMDQAAQRPFQVLVGVVAGLLARAQDDPDVAFQLNDRLGEHREAACAALPELAEVLGTASSSAGLGEGWQDGTARLGPESFGEVRNLQALSALLNSLGTADRAAVVLLDDCQWADELTLQLLKQWQQRRDGTGAFRHVLLVVAFRSEEAPEGHLLRRLNPSLHLPLPAFQPEDLRRLAESMAGPLPPAALAVVEWLSEGSPFLAAAVLQGLVESGALIPAEPAGWEVNSVALADVQSSRHAAAFLVRRIERLPATVLDLLSAGAVLGKEFDIEFAATLAGQSSAQAAAAFDEARRRHIVWGNGREAPCAFLHDKLRQTLLSRLAQEQRRDLHGRAASHLEKHDSGRVFDLAYHFDAAGDAERALHYALAAAEQARGRHALEVAEQHYRIAERGLAHADSPTRHRVAEGLGDVLMLRGRYANAAITFETALDLADSDFARAQVEGKLGELAFKRGDVAGTGRQIESALRRLGRQTPRWSVTFFVFVLWELFVQWLHSLAPRWFVGRRTLEGTETERLVMRLYSRLAHHYWFHRGTVPSLWAHLRELNLAERYPPTPELAQAYSEHAPAMSLIGRFPRGIAYAQKSLVIRKQLRDLWGQGQSLHFYGVVLYASSQFQECIERCRESVRLLERTGDYWEMHIARYQIAASHYRLGNFRKAVDEAQRIYQSGIDLGDIRASGIILDVWARASLGQVPAEIVRAELDRPSDDVQRTAQVLAAEGVRLLYRGDAEEAAATFDRAQQLLDRAGVKNAWVAPLLPWLATALRQQLESTTILTKSRRASLLRRAWGAARRAVKIARTFQNELPHALRECGLIAAMLGKSRKARRCLKGSLTAAERQGARFERALTCVARGRVGAELGWRVSVEEVARAEQELRQFEAEVSGLPRGSEEPVKPVTLSLADRFDTVLDAGRKIASALSREAVCAAAREAALRLLRGERCVIFDCKLTDSVGPTQLGTAGLTPDESIEYSKAMVQRCLAANRAVAFIEGAAADSSESVLLSGVRSALCAPIYVRGQPAAFFYVTHRHVAGLFGEDELRLADFIATLTGAALENAEGFAELRRLNTELEERIAERRRAERQIQEQAALLDEAQDAISVQDLDDRILFWNRSAQRLYGWSAAEAIGRKAGELLHAQPACPPDFQSGTSQAPGRIDNPAHEAIQGVLQRGEWSGELQQVTKDGKDIVVESRWTLVRDEEGRPKSRLIVSTDVTEKKKLETRLLRAQRLESLGTLAGGIAHDINNVLMPIMLSVDLLRQRLPESERLSILANLETVAQRGADMVRQILSFARGVEGQRNLLALKHLIKELERMLGSTFPKSIEFISWIQSDLWLLSGDATQLHQMLMNLCVNARDAMPDGGMLTVQAINALVAEPEAAQHAGARPGPHVLLTVTDTGTGIPPEIVDKIFDPFFTTKEYGKGTGLGLSTVLGIVKGHGGFIQVNSQLGQGTQFFIWLPAVESPQPQTAAPSSVDVPKANRGDLVLVVDDEAAIRDITRRNLECAGFRVLTARNGAEAVELYPRHRSEIRVVLTDTIMPGMDGPATIRALRELNPQLRIVAMSGLASSLEAMDVEVQATLSKPFKHEQLIETMNRVLQIHSC